MESRSLIELTLLRYQDLDSLHDVFLNACEKGDLRTVKLIGGFLLNKEEFFSFINRTNKVGKTALIVAATHGCRDIVYYLCSKGASGNIRDYGNWAARKHARYNAHDECADIIDRLTWRLLLPAPP